MINILGNQNSIVNQYISELRDVEIQKDRLRFRKNLERLGEIFAYEISKQLAYTMREVVTPLGIASVPVLQEQPIIGTILRAGIPLHQGLLNIF
jgi:uracil phosphoribosyltransferase